MAIARGFQLRTIRRHLLCRWLAWIAFIALVISLQPGPLTFVGILAVSNITARLWPLPHAKIAAWRVPPWMTIAAVIIVLACGLAQLAFPLMKGEWTRTTLGVVLGLIMAVVVATQVQLWRGRGLA